jgi:hypothetical protein
MAGPAPKTRDWAARENVHKPKGLHLIVSGHVQVTNTNMEPRLAESGERNPRTLDLALTIETTGETGADVLCWKQASFHKEVRANEYDTVIIRWDGRPIAQVRVVDDREHSQAQDKMMQAVNLKYGIVPAKKAAAKTAKTTAGENVVEKVADTVGTVAKAVGGWAKGAKKTLKKVIRSATGGGKKAAKKGAKKSAKKAVKKSAKKGVKKSAKKAKRPAKKTKKLARKSARRSARKGRR